MTELTLKGGFMIIRFNNEDGTHGYEQIDFRETMPAAGNETVRLHPKMRSADVADVHPVRCKPDQIYRRRSGGWRSGRASG